LCADTGGHGRYIIKEFDGQARGGRGSYSKNYFRRCADNSDGGSASPLNSMLHWSFCSITGNQLIGS
jgi:hypothetical protein